MQLFFSDRLRYFVYRAGCDMRKGYDGLSGIVRNEYRMDPLSGDVFVFFSRGLNKIKGIPPVNHSVCLDAFFLKKKNACY